MTIDEIKDLCDRLQVERKRLKELTDFLSKCDLNGHQENITVSVSGVGSIGITYCDRSTRYASAVISGRQMILLGIKKALAAMVDEQDQRVMAISIEIDNARVTQ